MNNIIKVPLINNDMIQINRIAYHHLLNCEKEFETLREELHTFLCRMRGEQYDGDENIPAYIKNVERILGIKNSRRSA